MSGLFAALWGTGPLVVLFLTVGVMGGCAALGAHALAAGWRPARQVLGYMILLTAADRFLAYALFGGHLLSLPAFLIDYAILAAIALASHRATLAARMTRQYPWLYRRDGPFGWREREVPRPVGPGPEPG